MTPQDIKNKYKTGYQFHKATGISATTFRNWMCWGFVPKLSQLLLQEITNGELKSSDDHSIKKEGGLLFRFHRGTLKDSMATAITVFSMNELEKYINKNFDTCIARSPASLFDEPDISFSGEGLSINITKYIYDDRIGWNTFLVTSELISGTNFVIGYLSNSPKTWTCIGDKK